jgi:hypothetical protein
MTSSLRTSILQIIFFTTLLSTIARADDITVTTYYPSPDTDYKSFSVRESLTAATATLRGSNLTTPLPVAPDVLAVMNNDIGGWAAGTHGGNLTVTGNLDITTTADASLLFVNAATNRVGLGTRTPRFPLEVVGDINAMIIAGHADSGNWSVSWTDMSALSNGVDSDDSSVQSYAWAKFAATYFDSDYRFGTLHLDGSPLVIQTIDKTTVGVTQALGRGQVVIRGVRILEDTTADDLTIVTPESLALVVGEAAGVYGANMPKCRANHWNLNSSAAYKKDIQPLSGGEYAKILGTMDRMNVVNFLYKGEVSTNFPNAGFIAEEAPSDFVSTDKKSVNLGDEMGFLLASAKALKAETDALDSRVRELKK